MFLHKIIPGVANRSYGIAVAKMAGMPENIVARAEQVLSNLESCDKDTQPVAKAIEKPSVKPVVEEPKPKSQLSLFG